jgi:hypothetical protein
MRAWAYVVAVASCAALISGCGEQGPGASEPVTSSAPSPSGPSSPPSPPTEGSTVEPQLQPVVDAAIEDLESRPDTGSEPVRVVLAREETFPDGALGCPQPGMSYSQALVEGYRVVLARGDREWLYTAGPDGVPSLCESGPEGEELDGSS